jgi:2-hydroxy-3-keto-5-methylthiopentenyl-1-phosphate phosphatase
VVWFSRPEYVLDLTQTSVFVDYDGTISSADTGVHLLDRLVGDTWHDLEDRYTRGKIGSLKCISEQWALLPNVEEQWLREVASEVPVDAAFGWFARELTRVGAEIAVVSDGYGFYAEDTCASLGVSLITNVVNWNGGELLFPNRDPTCECRSCGTCKKRPVLDAKRRGRITVFVGDGTSDQKVAAFVDVLFAKEELAAWCHRNSVTFHPFTTLRDVGERLGLGQE